MYLPDVNILIHAHNLESPVHERARRWWDDRLAGPEGVGLAWVTILGFVRISTHPRVLERPLRVDDVMSRIATWLEQPHVHIPQPSDRHFGRLRGFLQGLGVAGNLTTDAHLAALAIDRGYVVATTDSDFARFPGLKWKNPLRS
jgi:uncharacterized protein